MAETLRELFDEMMSDEPPLRTTSDSAAAAGRRLAVRRRALWTAAGAALTVVLATAVPTLATGGVRGLTAATGTSTAVPSQTPTGRPSTAAPTPSPSQLPDANVVSFHHCPQPTRYPSADTSDGSVLPNVDRAADLVQVNGPNVAPGKQFILRVHQTFTSTAKLLGRPQVALIFDVGDERGFGFIDFQILAGKGPTPAQWADNEINSQNGCVDVMRRDFPDGSIAIHIVPTNAQQAATSQQVYYYSAKGFAMNIGTDIQGWSASDDPNVPPPPPPLPVRKPNDLALTIPQIMALADVVAHA